MSSYFWFITVVKTIDTPMLFRSVFFKMHDKKVINFQKWPKWRFWRLIIFFGAFSKKTEQNNNCEFIVFKAESEPKHEEKKICVFFFKNQKPTFSGVKIK